ncbi:hypothetical protein [Alsobacter sp. SYSU BS001988]
MLAIAAVGAGALVWSGSERTGRPEPEVQREADETARVEARARRNLDLITALVDPAAATPEEHSALNARFRVEGGALTITGRCGETTAMPLASAALTWQLSCGRRGVSVDFGRSEDAPALQLSSAAQSGEACRGLAPRVSLALARSLSGAGNVSER